MVLYKTEDKKQISYYSDQGRTGLKGTIDLTSAREVQAAPDNDTRFIIVCPDRTWRLQAADNPERAAWIEAVRAVLAKKEEEVPGKKMDSVMGPERRESEPPAKVAVPGEVPEKKTMEPGTAIQVVNGKVSDAGLFAPPDMKRDPAASSKEKEEVDPSISAAAVVDNFEEFEEFMEPEEPAVDFEEVFGELCSLLDENSDDNLNLKEFSDMYDPWAKNFFSEFFKSLDKNMDSALSKDEFKQMFTLEDGSLDGKRVIQTIKEVQEVKFDKIFDDVCLIIDRNYDDRFDFNEFAELYPGASEEFFKKLDLNKDEFLSKKELKEYYRKDDKSLNIERVTEDYAMLEEQIYQQDIEKLCQMVNEDHAKDVINIIEFKSVYPEGTKVFINAIDGGDATEFKYEDILAKFRDEEKWGDFPKVRQTMVDMRAAMFDSHFEGLCALMDKNHNDTLDIKEFSEIYPVASDFFFKQLDSNQDNKLSKDELRQMFVLADGSMDVERMAQVEADIKEKIEKKNMMKDATIDDFLDAPEEHALEKKEKPEEVKSPESQFEEFEEPERTPEKKAPEPEKKAADTKTEEPVKKVEEPVKKVEEPVKKAEPTPVEKKQESEPQRKESEDLEPMKKPTGCCIIS